MNNAERKILKVVSYLADRLENGALPDFDLYSEYWEDEDRKLFGDAKFILGFLDKVKSDLAAARPLKLPDDYKWLAPTLIKALSALADLETRQNVVMDKDKKNEANGN